MKVKKSICRIGVDVGSTTLKIIILNPSGDVVYNVYRRHKASINNVFAEELSNIVQQFPDTDFTLHITGSAGMGISERTGVPFLQEVVASVRVVETRYPDTHTLIDLGGEDAKIVFFQSGRQPDIRMNGSCAGGTGAFIDQMADLMNISVEQLGQEGLQYETIYPVASRCGVFAKTDVQNLISRNIPRPDVAMSILHTVALQSITSLARGVDILPKILCIGGPLTFIPALRNAFKDILKVDDQDLFLPENSEYFPAWGAALYEVEDDVVCDLQELTQKLLHTENERKDTLPALFDSEEAYDNWKKTRKITHLKKAPLGREKEISCYMGIDSGSTTTKILIMDEEARLVYTFYDKNEGNPLKKVVEGLTQFYDEAKQKGVKVHILSSATTGYGEDLIKSALGLPYGIVETMAHLSGAQYVDPEVSFVLDIGGQDMKSLFIDKGVISNIEINEACSSGCGSFLQNFASTMNLSMNDFTREACLSKEPSDLGSRCTVFMNSKVKQSLRENAGLGNISAGLAYSVMKNCLFKVLKMSNLNRMGEHIVVQGGTFRNDAVYRALEVLSGKSVSSTDYPELMGAFGAALYARKMWQTNKNIPAFAGVEQLPDVEAIETKELHCKGCTNKCSVLRFRFDNGNVSYAGNKCEKVFYNKNHAPQKGYNAFDWKNSLLFDRAGEKPQTTSALRIGIPRVLNMFENFPFWHTLFTNCGLEVVLSPESTFSLYQRGVGSVMSDNICFPAKLAHGHILALVDEKVDRIFYPMITKEEKEFGGSTNSFNCPVVSGYPDVIRSSMDPEDKYGIPLDKPVINFTNKKILKEACATYLYSLGITKDVFESAFEKAMKEGTTFKDTLRNEQKERLDKAVQNNEWAFIVAGRPYHTDSLIHQKVGQILSDLGIHVFTDDVFRQPKSEGFGKLKIVSQWAYPNRVVQAAMEVAKLPQNVQLVQLNSFGCGPDSFFMDETGDILKHAGKNHTILRIDEISSSGSIRLRLRSLIESLQSLSPAKPLSVEPYAGYNIPYTKADKKKTILVPWFSDFISPFIPVVAELAGYQLVNLPKSSKASADAGLKYGNNEVCYPSTLVLGDIIIGLQSGKYDLNNVVVAITQTGGQCRATNYLSQIKTGLQNAGFAQIPVVVISSGKVYQNEQKAFKIPLLKFVNVLVYALLYADSLQKMYSSMIIREKKRGDTQALFDFYIERGIDAVKQNNAKAILQLMEQAVADFNQIPAYERIYTKIGLVGEIFVKYNNYGQAHITEWLRSKGMEVVTPPILDFLMQYFVNSEVNIENKVDRDTWLSRMLRPVFLSYMNKRINDIEAIMQDFKLYEPTESIFKKAEYAAEVLDLSNQFGEGWMIAAEVAVYARHGVNRVVCVQPFGCIANHVVAKGIEKRLKKLYPDMSLLYLDIDGGMAEVNLQNRLHFIM
ncbi:MULTISPECIES: acyl-CoA dehydratase activase-related protein [unclassified Parabacteroides]|uniref:acyl-CoA dehydratase activase-related protein n=1 Tax=unclassified Parabacteroides TaxID=2649774 RepID=UPI002474A0C9|nr:MULTISPECIES: acyl-CoA dehydratase activase-related protein [unclassified Parabacteroides]